MIISSTNNNTNYQIPIDMQRDTLAQVFSYLSREDLKAASCACKAFKQEVNHSFSYWLTAQYPSSFVSEIGGARKLKALAFTGILKQYGERSTVLMARELLALTTRTNRPLGVHTLHRICIESPIATASAPSQTPAVKKSKEVLIYRDQLHFTGEKARIEELEAVYAKKVREGETVDIRNLDMDLSPEDQAEEIISVYYKDAQNKNILYDCLCILRPGSSRQLEVNVIKNEVEAVRKKVGQVPMTSSAHYINALTILLGEEQEKRIIQEMKNGTSLTILKDNFYAFIMTLPALVSREGAAWLVFDYSEYNKKGEIVHEGNLTRSDSLPRRIVYTQDKI